MTATSGGLRARVRGHEIELVCHMGVLSGRQRPNSLEAIGECLEAGAGRVEIDVHSLDGADYIVSHERRLERETTASGAVGRATPDDVRAARFLDGSGGRPALLSEVVALARDYGTEIQLDLKDWRPLPAGRLRALIDVVAPVRDRVIVSSGQDWNLMRLHHADPELAFGFDPGHYIDHAVERDVVFLPRTMGAYGYRDDHPLAAGRTEAVHEYLRQRFEMLAMQAPAAREYFLSYRLVLQMLDDGFNIAEFLGERGAEANAWTLDYHSDESLRALEELAACGVRRVTTNTALALLKATGTARDD